MPDDIASDGADEIEQLRAAGDYLAAALSQMIEVVSAWQAFEKGQITLPKDSYRALRYWKVTRNAQ